MEQEDKPQGCPPVEPGTAPAGARLLAYFGHGAELAVIPGGMMLAIQADHLVETVRLDDLQQGGRRATKAKKRPERGERQGAVRRLG